MQSICILHIKSAMQYAKYVIRSTQTAEHYAIKYKNNVKYAKYAEYAEYAEYA